MQAKNCLYNIKAQTHAVFVLAAGFIRFIKPFENMRYLFRGNSLPAVFNLKHGFIRQVCQRQADIAALICKFYRVFHQIINNLVQHIRVAVYKQAFRLLQALYADLSLFYFLFKRQQCADNNACQIKPLFIHFKFAAVYSGQCQHGLHQPGKAPDFYRYNI